MSLKYSAHPAIAAEQLRTDNATAGTTTGSKSMLTQHRRHKSASGMLTHKATAASGSNCDTTAPVTRGSSCTTNTTKTKTPNSSIKHATANTTTTTLSDKCDQSENSTRQPSDAHFMLAGGATTTTAPTMKSTTTKDCQSEAVSFANTTPVTHSKSAVNEQLQRRFMRSCSRSPFHQQAHSHATDTLDGASALSDGCRSSVSSTFSSPAPSTDSTPLSTPTRLPQQLHHVHQYCCQKAISSSQHHMHSHQHHHHHHHHHQQHSSAKSVLATNAAAAGGGDDKNTATGCKEWKKFDPRLGPSPYRQLLPIALCIITFAIVFTILIVYMDKTEIRHQQFRLNMSRDYELRGVAQDDPSLIAFLRQIHIRKNPMHFLKSRETSDSIASSSSSSSISSTGSLSSLNNVVDQHWNFSAHRDELTPAMAYYVAELVGNKRNGAVLQSMTGTVGHLLTAPWLVETLNWMGVVVEPEPRRYFSLGKQSAQQHGQMQIIHACVAPTSYPKEVTIHYEDADVRINSLHDEETSWFNSRVKCFPLYSIMLACERIQYDLLSLGVHGHELEILQTLPFEKVQVEIVSIHLPEDHTDIKIYIQAITKFLAGKSYRLQRTFGRNYFYQRIVSASSRTRKKDILLLKTP